MSVVAVVGLGYVGLPLAVEFGKKGKTIGYDPSSSKIESYKRYVDPTGEVSCDDLQAAKNLTVTTDPAELSLADYIVVSVPTPVDLAHKPDFTSLINASETIARHMKHCVIVTYESTVYPGATEEICVPVLEKHSGMKWKKDFHVGFSPERINPGDKKHTLTAIVKVVAGDDDDTLEKIAVLYESVITAGVHRTSSIKVAEAAKVIENTQRDLNIALMNELAIIFDRLEIDSLEVLQAAGTKWNFLPFRPGLVGGHCIGVDPYYLTYKAQQLGYHPEMILAGRRINDNMSLYVVSRIIKKMLGKGMQPMDARVLVLGLAFKENCPDVRNTKVIDIVRELVSYGAIVDVHDPWVNADDAMAEYGVELRKQPAEEAYDVVVVAVGHQQFKDMGAAGIRRFCKNRSIVYDIKYLLPQDSADDRL